MFVAIANSRRGWSSSCGPLRLRCHSPDLVFSHVLPLAGKGKSPRFFSPRTGDQGAKASDTAGVEAVQVVSVRNAMRFRPKSNSNLRDQVNHKVRLERLQSYDVSILFFILWT